MGKLIFKWQLGERRYVFYERKNIYDLDQGTIFLFHFDLKNFEFHLFENGTEIE